MKTRATRYETIIDASMTGDAGSCNAVILNASAKGLALHSTDPPRQGSYVEVRAGDHVLVARVVWALDDSFGVQMQGTVPVEFIPTSARGASQLKRGVPVAIDFIGFARPNVIHDRSKAQSLKLQFAFLIILSAGAAGLAFASVETALTHPMKNVRTALSGE